MIEAPIERFEILRISLANSAGKNDGVYPGKVGGIVTKEHLDT